MENEPVTDLGVGLLEGKCGHADVLAAARNILARHHHRVTGGLPGEGVACSVASTIEAAHGSMEPAGRKRMNGMTFGLHPEGDTGLWVFRIIIPNVGQVIRGEVKVKTILGEEEVTHERQKAMALEKVHLLAGFLLDASAA